LCRYRNIKNLLILILDIILTILFSKGLKINNFAKKKLDLTAEELLYEKNKKLWKCAIFIVYDF